MKSAGEVFRKLKEAKFRHWVIILKKLSRKTPDNCKYNYTYNFNGENGQPYTLKLCMLHQDSTDLKSGIYPHLIDVCQADSDCQNCNAFIAKYSRDDIKNIFEQELTTKSIKEKKYPEICALEWVLEKYNEGYPPVSWFQALYFRIKKWFLNPQI